MNFPQAAPRSVLVTYRRSELGRLFRAGSAQTVPDRHGRGTALLGTGGALARLAATVVSAAVWKGKVVDARGMRLRNLISPLGIPAISAEIYRAPSWYDGGPCIVLDYSKTSWVARIIRDEIREIEPGVFVGPIYWGRRHIFDFTLTFNQER